MKMKFKGFPHLSPLWLLMEVITSLDSVQEKNSEVKESE